MASITLKNISKKYYNYPKPNDELIAVSNLNLEIKDKEIIVLVGPSGCGKSTTLRMIAGLETISEGELYIDGRPVNDVEPKNRDISMVFQNYALYPHMNVFENIAFGLQPTNMSEDEIKIKVHEVARVLDVTHLLTRKPKELSGGQKQRVALGRVLIRDHKVVLLDEPLSHLDTKLRSAMRIELMKLHRKFNTTYIYVTHDQTEAMTIANRIVVMKEGVIQQVGKPEYLYSHPCNVFVAGFLGSPQINFFHSKVTESGNDIFVNLCENEIKIPYSKADKIGEYIGKEIYCGIRAENLYGDKINIDKYKDFLIEANVTIKEFMGDRVNLHCETENNCFTVRVSPDCAAKSGDKIKIAVNPEKIHFFDKDTELAIIN